MQPLQYRRPKKLKQVVAQPVATEPKTFTPDEATMKDLLDQYGPDAPVVKQFLPQKAGEQ